MQFVNRDRELNALEEWWSKPGSSLGLVWGRRRIGKTALLRRFARSRRSVFHTASVRPLGDELIELSRAAAPAFEGAPRNLLSRPFASWDDALESLSTAAESEPLLVVFDEFPELVAGISWLPSVMRAQWDRLGERGHLKILLSGSAARTTMAIQEARSPLYGRFDVTRRLDPLWPHEAAQMLPGLTPPERALVWGIVGGIPLYLSWWDQERSVAENLELLACQPGSRLITEAMLLVETEAVVGDLGKRVLHAIANGRTKHNEIADVVRADPTRTLERLEDVRLVERLAPVTEDDRVTPRRRYRVADNLVAFKFGVLDHYRAEIDCGNGNEIVPALMSRMDDFLGPRWEQAFRMHVRRLTSEGQLAQGVVAVGPFWRPGEDPAEIDAVALAGVEERAVLAGEAKWSRRVDGARIRRQLERKVQALPNVAPDLQYIVCAREQVDNAGGVVAVTAADIFDG